MPQLTRARAAWLAAAAAAAVYALSLRNGWAGDDMVAIRDNPAAHSVRAALNAWFDPYWPENFRWAGLYRPFTVLTYGVDWTLSGGATWWFHAVNVGLHALVTGLVVLVAAAWLPVLGALGAGLLFAVHPVHVEAVANTVGRAELLVAAGLVLALLAARRYRRAGSRRQRAAWLTVTIGAVAFAIFSKEQGVVAIALIALDHAFDRERSTHDSVSLYAGVAVLTIAWLFVWRGIAGAYVAGAGHTALAYLTPAERVTTMLPAYLEALRLLAWPFSLASDYSPQVIPVRLTLSWVGALGLASSAASLTLGVLLVKRVPVVAFAIFFAAVTYFPTSNLLFASGVVVAERNLYLAILLPALLLGWGLAVSGGKQYRRAVLVGAGVVLLAFGYRSVERIPFWRDAQTPIAEERAAHPENFQTRVVLGRQLAALGDSSWALAELLVAGALLPTDPGAAVIATHHAATQGRRFLALREARRAYDLLSDDPVIVKQLAAAYAELGALDSARAVLTRGVDAMPFSAELLEQYRLALSATNAPRWRQLLGGAQRAWVVGDLVRAAAQLDTLAADVPSVFTVADDCAAVRRAVGIVRALKPELARSLEARGAASDPRCALDPKSLSQ
jgi:hypothetical protein